MCRMPENAWSSVPSNAPMPSSPIKVRPKAGDGTSVHHPHPHPHSKMSMCDHTGFCGCSLKTFEWVMRWLEDEYDEDVKSNMEDKKREKRERWSMLASRNWACTVFADGDGTPMEGMMGEELAKVILRRRTFLSLLREDDEEDDEEE
eukprot:TRINITY_DN3725_c0_g2_i1.p2 TRINITY_DN3725_c0_g2~~TRINITY_DN3725_c0_g2_i1.p2  ORF type:complete len:147 (+),score=46.86 TRINITY_DN3725_c0_g2_i1:597-1037(+)